MAVDLSEAQARFTRLRQYAAQDPANKRLVLDAANAGLNSHDVGGAEALVRDALSRLPGDTELMFTLGTILLASGQYGDAAGQFDALLKAAESHPAIRYNLAYAHQQLGDFAAVLETLEPLDEAQATEIPEVLQLRGRACHHLEQLDQAIRWFRRYANLRSDRAQAWGELALAAFDGDDEATARIAAEQALKLNPQESTALLALGGMALEQRAVTPALENFGMVVANAPENGRAWSGLAYAHMMKLDFTQAMPAFEKAVRYMPNHIGTWHGLAWLQILQKDLGGAEASFQKALALDRNFGETHGGLAVVAALKGQDADAEKMARRGIGLNPQSFAARYARTLLLRQQGKADQAQAGVEAIMASASADGAAGFDKMVADLLAQVQSSSKKPKSEQH